MEFCGLIDPTESLCAPNTALWAPPFFACFYAFGLFYIILETSFMNTWTDRVQNVTVIKLTTYVGKIKENESNLMKT